MAFQKARDRRERDHDYDDAHATDVQCAISNESNTRLPFRRDLVEAALADAHDLIEPEVKEGEDNAAQKQEPKKVKADDEGDVSLGMSSNCCPIVMISS